MVVGASSLPLGFALALPDAYEARGRLRWSGKGRFRRVDPNGMLDRFQRISRGADVAAFARDFGTIGVCLHHQPSSHRTQCRPLGWPNVAEPIDTWLDFAAQARALIHLGADLREPNLRRTERRRLWSIVGGPDDEVLGDFHENVLQRRGAQFMVSFFVREWLELGDARPALVWPPRTRATPTLELTAGGTFGQLAIQLAITIAGAHDLAICDGCRLFYARQGRKPQRGRRNYCSTCQRSGIPERDRKRAQRARQPGNSEGAAVR